MMDWFEKTAPIRLKLLVAFSVMTMPTIVVAFVATTDDPKLQIIVGLAATLSAIFFGFWFRHLIATPYVATVARMEALAAGDLTSEIRFTDYADCVGRLTRAMFTFRDTAQQQIDANHHQINVVETMAGKMRLLAAGDLTADVTADFGPGFADLRDNFNAALHALRIAITAVSDGTQAIRTGSSEISQASEDLARRTESNAASLEQTSAALAQIDQRLKATATAANDTVARADQAIATVEGGRATAEDAVQAMGRVGNSAKGIDTVIEGLDKIAFQTRVLAMNAAVEAGRAGDAGRGFAVVADLVSALAMRAEEEAKRARDQLTVTQTEIFTAVEAVQKVDGALANIAGDVGAVHKLLGSMASDNKAQSGAISEISTAVSTMDRATQQNAAMVEETSAAARSLLVEVGSLAEHAGKFIIHSASQPAPARSVPATTAMAQPPRKPRSIGGQPSNAAKAAFKPAAIANGHANGHTAHDDWKDF